MCKWVSALVLGAVLGSHAVAQQRYPGVGRTATPAEVRAWDIDVRADFKGLPAGSGSVSKGRDLWDAKCASCHGTFGESNEVFPPIVGGTTSADVKAGRVKALLDPDTPRSTMMKLARISTLWDYIRRAMPWTAPKSLTTDEVYAVSAYILNMADIVADDFVLSDRNIADVQRLLPNRDGLTREHGLWSVKGKPDVANVACMNGCANQPKVTSALPEQARGAHGDLADQMRDLGPVRGVHTGVARASPSPVATAGAAGSAGTGAAALAGSAGCLACHGVSSKLVGPAFTDIAAKYGDNPEARALLAGRIAKGSAGAWGALPMPAQTHVKPDQISALVEWITSGAK